MTFTTSQNLSKGFFGDEKAISRVVTRLAIVLSTQNKESPMSLNFSSGETTFGSALNVDICVKNPELSEDEIGHLIILAKQTELKIEKLNTTEQKLIGALRLARKVNCKIDASFNDNVFTISLSFPQLVV